MDKTKIYASLGDFAIRDVVYIDGHHEPDRYDIVKYYDHDPIEVTDWHTGEKKTSTRSCISLGTLIWDNKDEWFEFESCGLRYLKEREDGLEDLIFLFTNAEAKRRADKDE